MQSDIQYRNEIARLVVYCASKYILLIESARTFPLCATAKASKARVAVIVSCAEYERAIALSANIFNIPIVRALGSGLRCEVAYIMQYCNQSVYSVYLYNTIATADWPRRRATCNFVAEKNAEHAFRWHKPYILYCVIKFYTFFVKYTSVSTKLLALSANL